MVLVVAESSALTCRARMSLDRLWDAAFDDFTAEDAAHAYGGLHVLLVAGGEIVAHGSAVPRAIVVGNRSFAAGYVEAVATLPSCQNRGIGTRVMRELGAVVSRRFELGVLSTGSPGFYERLGWERWRGPSYVLRDGARVRTEDEDDGVMVLRFGASRCVDLSAPIACFDRPGDAW